MDNENDAGAGPIKGYVNSATGSRYFAHLVYRIPQDLKVASAKAKWRVWLETNRAQLVWERLIIAVGNEDTVSWEVLPVGCGDESPGFRIELKATVGNTPNMDILNAAITIMRRGNVVFNPARSFVMPAEDIAWVSRRYTSNGTPDPPVASFQNPELVADMLKDVAEIIELFPKQVVAATNRRIKKESSMKIRRSESETSNEGSRRPVLLVTDPDKTDSVKADMELMVTESSTIQSKPHRWRCDSDLSLISSRTTPKVVVTCSDGHKDRMLSDDISSIVDRRTKEKMSVKLEPPNSDSDRQPDVELQADPKTPVRNNRCQQKAKSINADEQNGTEAPKNPDALSSYCKKLTVDTLGAESVKTQETSFGSRRSDGSLSSSAPTKRPKATSPRISIESATPVRRAVNKEATSPRISIESDTPVRRAVNKEATSPRKSIESATPVRRAVNKEATSPRKSIESATPVRRAVNKEAMGAKESLRSLSARRQTLDLPKKTVEVEEEEARPDTEMYEVDSRSDTPKNVQKGTLVGRTLTVDSKRDASDKMPKRSVSSLSTPDTKTSIVWAPESMPNDDAFDVAPSILLSEIPDKASDTVNMKLAVSQEEKLLEQEEETVNHEKTANTEKNASALKRVVSISVTNVDSVTTDVTTATDLPTTSSLKTRKQEFTGQLWISRDDKSAVERFFLVEPPLLKIFKTKKQYENKAEPSGNFNLQEVDAVVSGWFSLTMHVPFSAQPWELIPEGGVKEVSLLYRVLQRHCAADRFDEDDVQFGNVPANTTTPMGDSREDTSPTEKTVEAEKPDVIDAARNGQNCNISDTPLRDEIETPNDAAISERKRHSARLSESLLKFSINARSRSDRFVAIRRGRREVGRLLLSETHLTFTAESNSSSNLKVALTDVQDVELLETGFVVDVWNADSITLHQIPRGIEDWAAALNQACVGAGPKDTPSTKPLPRSPPRVDHKSQMAPRTEPSPRPKAVLATSPETVSTSTMSGRTPKKAAASKGRKVKRQKGIAKNTSTDTGGDMTGLLYEDEFMNQDALAQKAGSSKQLSDVRRVFRTCDPEGRGLIGSRALAHLVENDVKVAAVFGLSDVPPEVKENTLSEMRRGGGLVNYEDFMRAYNFRKDSTHASLTDVPAHSFTVALASGGLRKLHIYGNRLELDKFAPFPSRQEKNVMIDPADVERLFENQSGVVLQLRTGSQVEMRSADGRLPPSAISFDAGTGVIKPNMPICFTEQAYTPRKKNAIQAAFALESDTHEIFFEVAKLQKFFLTPVTVVIGSACPSSRKNVFQKSAQTCRPVFGKTPIARAGAGSSSPRTAALEDAWATEVEESRLALCRNMLASFGVPFWMQKGVTGDSSVNGCHFQLEVGHRLVNFDSTTGNVILRHPIVFESEPFRGDLSQLQAPKFTKKTETAKILDEVALICLIYRRQVALLPVLGKAADAQAVRYEKRAWVEAKMYKRVEVLTAELLARGVPKATLASGRCIHVEQARDLLGDHVRSFETHFRIDFDGPQMHADAGNTGGSLFSVLSKLFDGSDVSTTVPSPSMTSQSSSRRQSDPAVDLEMAMNSSELSLWVSRLQDDLIRHGILYLAADAKNSGRSEARYFILFREHLKSYFNPLDAVKGMAPDTVLDIGSVEAVEARSSTKFTILTCSTTMCLEAPDPIECQKWIKAIAPSTTEKRRSLTDSGGRDGSASIWVDTR